MARVLPGPLLGSIDAAGAAPAFSVTLGAAPPAPVKVADSGIAADNNYRTSICDAYGGTVFRVTVPVSGSSVEVLRITDPTIATQWTAAPTTIATGVNSVAGASMCSGSGGHRLLYQRASDGAPCQRISTDDGLTWGAEFVIGPGGPNLLPDPSGVITAFLCGDVNTIYCVCPNADGSVRLVKTTVVGGIAWSGWTVYTIPGTPGVAAGAGPIALSNSTPAAAFYAIMGIEPKRALGYGLGTSLWNGTAFAGVEMIQRCDNPSLGLSYRYPGAIGGGDIASYFAIASLYDDGSVSGVASTRADLYWTPNPATTAWRVVASIGGDTSPYGWALLIRSGTLYLASRKELYTLHLAGYQPITSTTGGSPIEADLLDLQITERPGRPIACGITLANKDAAYTPAQITPSMEVTVSFGYDGIVQQTHIFTITNVAFHAGGPQQTVTIAALDAAYLLGRISPRMLVLTSKTVGYLISYLCTQSGLSAAIPGSGKFTQVVPCFIVHPGDSWESCLNRLADLYDFTWSTGGGVSVTIFDHQAADPAVWTYGSETLGVGYGQSAEQATVVRVIGGSNPPVFAEAVDSARIALTGQRVYRHIVDRLLTTSAQCAIRANAALRDEQRHSTQGSLTVTINPAHQLMDVVTISDGRVGCAATAMRIEGIDWHVDWESGAWYQTLSLAAP